MSIEQFQAVDTQNYQPSSLELNETRFGQWLQKQCTFLNKKQLLDNDSNYAKQESQPGVITPAGIFFIEYVFAPEIAKHIQQYLVWDLSPLILGVHAGDLYYKRGTRHTEIPYLRHTPHGSVIQCNVRGGCRIKEKITVPDGFFKNTNLQNAPLPIRSFFKLLQTASKRIPNAVDPTLCIVNPIDNRILTCGTDRQPYEWKIKATTRNKAIFSDPHSSNNTVSLIEFLALLDAENRLHGRTPPISLTKNSYNAIERIKQKIIKDTKADQSYTDPAIVMVPDNFSNTTYTRKSLTRDGAPLKAPDQK